VPAATFREGELEEKPPQHLAHQQRFANASGEAKIDLRLAAEEDIARMRRHYYAKITTVDEQLGKVLDALDARGYLENSLLVFCSDHGEMLGDHKLPYKWLMYDPIVHVPMMVRHPGTVRDPEETEDLVSLMDIGPTVLDAAGIDVPTYLEGRSLRPYLDGERIAPRAFVFCEDNYQIMMRSQDHKLVYYIGQEEGELYDLRKDPGELQNLWLNTGYADVRDRLRLRLLEWVTTSNYYNAGYKRNRSRRYAMRWPGEGDASLHGPSARSRQVDYL